ncbi:SH3 domain-containing protein [Thiomicrospira microaerophila]|uniref:SH3 domain-containing protein n=1 Tax=Thiomicrospira microaerophila TaxID=406020 RepID=UPI0012FD4DA2|nr:SH3 domain-containing protein [Thiomicrospira microaerophila]
MSEPAFNASLVTTLRLGDEVIQLRQQGAWFEITMTDGSSGWISRFLARDTPPSERVTVLPSDGNVELRDVRRRTSALTTAAAARGLAGSADAGDGLQADTEALRYMEGFSVSPDSIKMFMQPIITGAQ